DREDASLFEAVGGSHRKADLGGAHFQAITESLGVLVVLAQWNSGHGFPPNLDGCVKRFAAVAARGRLAASPSLAASGQEYNVSREFSKQFFAERAKFFRLDR